MQVFLSYTVCRPAHSARAGEVNGVCMLEAVLFTLAVLAAVYSVLTRRWAGVGIALALVVLAVLRPWLMS